MTGKNAENKLVDRPPVRKFSPGMYQSDEEIISQFVIRNHELKIILEVLHGNIKSSSCQHVLVVAPRGRGKTMLLARVATELRVNDEFSERLLPVRFMEESQEISTLADFWLETLFHLAREIATYNPELARELRETYAALTDRWQEREIGDHARAAVLAAVDQFGRKLVLMVENLQALCESVDEDFGWRLREALQSEPQIMLLASATSRFESLDDVKQPFFELFRIVNLERLATKDCQLLWEVISGKEASVHEIRPLEILTGGSPRLLVIIAEFARHGSMRQLMEELVALIDEHTEYFRNHLENFPKMERRVYLAVIDLWQPSKPREIAARARMNIRSTSTMLGRLINRGAVIVEGSGKKRLYVAAERLYSIYYKLRRERDEAAVVQNLIHFMVVFYSEEELTAISGKLIEEATKSKTIREGIKRAIAERSRLEDLFSSMKWQAIRQISNRAFENYHVMHEQYIEKQIDTAFEEEEFKKVIEIANQALASQDANPSLMPESRMAQLLLKKVVAYERLTDFEVAIAVCNEIVERFDGRKAPDIKWQVTEAMVRKGDSLGKLGDYQAAITAYDEVVERFGDSDVEDLLYWVAAAMVNKGNKLERVGDHQAAIAAYDEVVERFGDSDVEDLLWWVAAAMVDKGNKLERDGDHQAAIAAYDEVIERFGDSDVEDLLWWVLEELFKKGDKLGELGDHQAAIAAYDEVVERFGNSDVPYIQRRIVEAMVKKGDELGNLGDHQAAITAYDEVVERFSDSDVEDLLYWITAAMVNKGNELERADDHQAAITAYDEVVERFGDSDVEDLLWWVAAAMVNKGNKLERAGDHQAAITAYDEVVERFGNSDVEDLLWWVAAAMVDKGYKLGMLGNYQEAITAYNKVVERFDDSDALQLKSNVAEALINKAKMQIKIRNPEEALRTCEKLRKRIDTLDSNEKIEFAWQMMYVRTLALMLQKRHDDAMDAFRSMYAKFIPGEESMMREMLHLVPDMVAIGAPEQDIVDILLNDGTKSSLLEPLIVALRQRVGEIVSAPAEVLEVAADIQRQITEKMQPC